MGEEKLLTVREVSQVLGISEKDVLDLAEAGSVAAYKVGGVYLRFKKEQVDDYKRSSGNLNPKVALKTESVLRERISDFFYFNDFYILAAILIALLAAVVYRGL